MSEYTIIVHSIKVKFSGLNDDQVDLLVSQMKKNGISTRGSLLRLYDWAKENGLQAEARVIRLWKPSAWVSALFLLKR